MSRNWSTPYHSGKTYKSEKQIKSPDKPILLLPNYVLWNKYHHVILKLHSPCILKVVSFNRLFCLHKLGDKLWRNSRIPFAFFI